MELNMIPDIDVRRGVIEWTEGYPPNIVEFKKLFSKKIQAPKPKMYTSRALSAPVDREIAKNSINKIKQMIAGINNG